MKINLRNMYLLNECRAVILRLEPWNISIDKDIKVISGNISGDSSKVEKNLYDDFKTAWENRTIGDMVVGTPYTLGQFCYAVASSQVKRDHLSWCKLFDIEIIK